MRWTRTDIGSTNDVGSGRQRRVVLAPLGWCQVCRDDLQATVTTRSWTPGRARRSLLTPSRRECRCFGFICGDYACVLLSIAHKAAGVAQTPGIPCALCLSGCSHTSKTRARSRAPRMRTRTSLLFDTMKRKFGVVPDKRAQIADPSIVQASGRASRRFCLNSPWRGCSLRAS
jgi:hypothetical protein